MISKNDTSSVRVMMTGIALSAWSLTTTLNTSGMIYNNPPLAIMSNISENDILIFHRNPLKTIPQQ